MATIGALVSGHWLTQINLMREMCFWHHSNRSVGVRRKPVVVACRLAPATLHFIVPPTPSCKIFPQKCHSAHWSPQSAWADCRNFYSFCADLQHHHWSNIFLSQLASLLWCNQSPSVEMCARPRFVMHCIDNNAHFVCRLQHDTKQRGADWRVHWLLSQC